MWRLRLIKVFLVASIVFFGFLLRAYMYQYFPFSGEPDELYSVWNGLSLINDKVPASWSGYGVYKKENIIFSGWVEGKWESGNHAPYRIVKPWFDHFPPFSLIVGANAKIFNLKNFTVMPTGIIRLPMLLIGLVNITLVFIVAKKLYNFKTALMALIIYATSPMIVFSSRLVICENLMITFELLIILFVTRYLELNNKNDLFLVYLSIFLAFITKATGVFFALGVLLTLLLYDRKKESIMILIPLLLGGILMLLYGFHYDGSLFLKVMKVNATRGVGLSTIALYFLKSSIFTAVFFDGWFYFGFISMLLIFSNYKNKKEKSLATLIVFFISWLIALIMTSAETDIMGWYRYPLFPLMAIASGKLIIDFIEENSVFGLIFCFLFLLTGFYTAKVPIRGELIKAIIILSTVITAISICLKRKPGTLIRASYVIILFFMIVGNSLAIINFYKKTCENTECNIPIKSNIKFVIPGWKKVTL